MHNYGSWSEQLADYGPFLFWELTLISSSTGNYLDDNIATYVKKYNNLVNFDPLDEKYVGQSSGNFYQDPLNEDIRTLISSFLRYVINKDNNLYFRLLQYNNLRDGLLTINMINAQINNWKNSLQNATIHLFRKSLTKHSENDDINSAIQSEFGIGYRIADWNDIVLYCQINTPSKFINDLDWASGEENSLMVTKDNQGFWSGIRHYYISRFDHAKPDHYLSHANIDNHLIDLGSWYGLNMPILVYNTQSTDVKSNRTELINEFHLYNNYPNPFNPTTNIEFQIAKSGFVTLKVYDVLGREVAVLVNEEKSTGKYKIIFNGERLISSIYFYQLRTGNFVETKKLVLLK